MLKINQKMAVLSAMCVLLTSSVPAYAADIPVLVKDSGGQMMFVTESQYLEAQTDMLDNRGNRVMYEVGEHGEVLAHAGINDGFYAVTDGSEIPDDFLHPSWLDPEDIWITCEEINPDEISWADGAENWFSGYPEGARLFRIHYDTNLSRRSGMLTRQLSLKYDGITDVFTRRYERTSAVVWDGAFRAEVRIPDTEEYVTVMVLGYLMKDNEYLPEQVLERLQEAETMYQEWNDAQQRWLASVDVDSMTPAELEASRKQAGVLSDYEISLKAFAIADSLYTEYPDIFQFIAPNVRASNPESLDEIYYDIGTWDSRFISLWDSVGDVNNDDKISSSDAAKVLSAASAYGTGNFQYDSDYDINADGKINSADAALLLEYAAQTGSGSWQDIKEFLQH